MAELLCACVPKLHATAAAIVIVRILGAPTLTRLAMCPSGRWNMSGSTRNAAGPSGFLSPRIGPRAKADVAWARRSMDIRVSRPCLLRRAAGAVFESHSRDPGMADPATYIDFGLALFVTRR